MAKAGKVGKQKTHKGTKKRFKITATGKVIADQANNSHLKHGKSKKSKKRNGKGTEIVGGMAPDIRKLLSN